MGRRGRSRACLGGVVALAMAAFAPPAAAQVLQGLVRWSNTAGLTVFETTDGSCYQARGRGCLPVYQNGMRLTPETVDVFPLEVAETVVIVMPNETIQYPGGALLLYTEDGSGRRYRAGPWDFGRSCV